MLCQECKQNPATHHFRKIVNGEKVEVYLCDKCSQEKGEMFMLNGNPYFSLNSLLAGLLNIEPNYKKAQQNTFANSLEDVRCDHCHMSYKEFARIGRFGCAHCYTSFEKQLEPILKRLHGGNSTHVGKIPERIGGGISLRKRINDLKAELQESIQREEFERAAELRDEIRALEKENSNSPKGENHS
ncbi:UvrB/UvrC motif-containing protein [Bacillus testis]|uniref:UvrB/UvrC motif-containing protein n=1 Tax=Bacillus testis TaxID=1622072 RepID=UPI00067F1A57|nr:UvrB/UvrC motif-containing protein [Bacillus testis]